MDSGNVQLLGMDLPRKVTDVKRSMWIALVVCSVFAILILALLVIYAEVRTVQSNNLAKIAELQINQSNNLAIITQLWAAQSNSLAKIDELQTNQSDHRTTLAELRAAQLKTNAALRDDFLQLTAGLMDVMLGHAQNHTSMFLSYIGMIEERISSMETSQKHFLTRARDCKSLLDKNLSQDGVYTIYPGGNPVDVWCEMSTNGSIVLTKRYDGSINFNRTFQQYSDGFGDIVTEFWLGLKYVHRITETGNWTLRIDLEDFHGEKRYAEYSGFRIAAGPDYTLNFDINSYRGNAGDSLHDNNGMKFSAGDMDQDEAKSNCALKFGGGGGWWYNSCGHARTTGMPYGKGHAIWWHLWKSDVLKFATLKIRRTSQ